MNILGVSHSVEMLVRWHAYIYGAGKCWFQHSENEHKENNQNQKCEITSKLFDMMETFTDRIMKIEKQMETASQ